MARRRFDDSCKYTDGMLSLKGARRASPSKIPPAEHEPKVADGCPMLGYLFVAALHFNIAGPGTKGAHRW
jgi:hypothetical protein